MSRESKAIGAVMLRQVWSKAGRNYFAVTMSNAAVELLGWRPGEMLNMWPASDGTMRYNRLGEPMTDVHEKAHNFQTVRGTRPGSIEERELEVEQTMTKLAESMARRAKKYDWGDPAEEDRKGAEAVARSQKREKLKAKTKARSKR